jgi:hypothetical protein
VARFKNDVAGANTSILIDSLSGHNSNLQFAAAGVYKWYLQNNAGVDDLRLYNSDANGNAEVFTVLQGGNVGIGQTSPGYKLDVNGTLGFQTTLYGNGKDAIDTGDTYLRINQGLAFTNGIWLGSSPLREYQGHIYVGSGGGAGEVDISGTSGDGTNRITINGNSGANSWFNTGGNVGIGTAAPGYQLQVNGTAMISSGFYLGTGIVSHAGTAGGWGANYMNMSWDGTCIYIWVDAIGTALNCPSDKRVKKDILTLPQEDGLAGIMQLNPVSFYWKNIQASKEKQFGLIAQNTANVFPNLVINTGMKTKETPDGMLRINYDGLFAPLIKAVQQLKSMFDGDHDDIAKLKAANDNEAAEIKALTARLNTLEAAHR